MARVYEYDLYISYHRDGGTVPAWVRTHFYPRLSELLEDNVDRKVKIFFDEHVRGGVLWAPELRSALQRTRILVPVCSPAYFGSEWCLAEWHSMAKREQLVGMATQARLIYPVIFCDSRNFPTYAHERRMQDLKKWNLPYPQFQETLAYLDFHSAVERIALELVDLIEQAPTWQPDWPVVLPPADPPPTSSLPRF
ncbi:MAG TPA: TIR domain-containing protein [Pseudonocardiaceae bacterium]|nr:TIR domain-containing protein [Pseudonocardiaceae bacterium]